MDYQSQGLSASAESLLTVESCIKKISPDIVQLNRWNDEYLTRHRDRIALDLDIVKEQVLENQHVLEVGSIPLLFTCALLNSNFKVTGVDIEPDRYKSAIKKIGVDIHRCDIEQETLPFDDHSFDAIIFNELFEHLRINPIFTFSEVFRVMKPGAVMMLSSPNLRSINGILNFLLKNRSYSCSGGIYQQYNKIEKLGHMGHVREYTTTEITEFLEMMGFSVTSIVFRGGYRSLYKKILIKMFPSLRPVVSYNCKKTNASVNAISS